MTLSRRAALVSAGLLLLVIAVAPWVSGRLAEHLYWQALSELEAGYGDRLSIRGAYERSYGSAAGVTRVTLLSGNQRPAITLTLETAIEHGFSGVSSVTSARGPLFPAREEVPELHLHAGLWQGLSGEYRVPALSWPAPDSDGDPVWDKAAPEPERLALEELEGTFSWRPGRTLSFIVQADHLRGSHQWSLQPLELTLSWEREGKWLDGFFSLQTGALQHGTTSLGSQHWQAQLRRFHAPSLGDVARSLDALYGRPEAPGRVAEAEARRSAFNDLSEALQQLSVRGGELNLNLDGGGQALQGALQLSYPAFAEPRRQLPMSLIQHLHGQARLQLEPDYVRRLPDYGQRAVSHWRDKGWLRPGPGGLVLEAQLHQQVLLINEAEPIKLPPLL